MGVTSTRCSGGPAGGFSCAPSATTTLASNAIDASRARIGSPSFERDGLDGATLLRNRATLRSSMDLEARIHAVHRDFPNGGADRFSIFQISPAIVTT